MTDWSVAGTRLYTLQTSNVIHAHTLTHTIEWHGSPARPTNFHSCTSSGCRCGPYARLWHPLAPGRRPHRLTSGCPAVPTAGFGEDGVPPNERRVSCPCKLPRASWSLDLRASASCALAGDGHSSAAPRVDGPRSATWSARRPPLHIISAASSGRPRRREQRQRADFPWESGRCHPYGNRSRETRGPCVCGGNEMPNDS